MTDQSQEFDTDGFYRIIGGRIRIRRAELGFSQELVGKKLGKSRVSIVNIELGKQKPPIHVIWKLATILNIDPHSLLPSHSELEAELSKQILDEKMVSLINDFTKNDPHARHHLTSFIQSAIEKNSN